LVLLSKLEETLIVNGRRFELSTNRYPGVVHPHGFQFLKQFRLDPFPTFTFGIDGIEIEKTVFMVQGKNTTVIDYHVSGVKRAINAQLEIRPLIAFRDYHSLTHENHAINRSIDEQDEQINISPYSGLPSLYLANNAGSIETTGHWYRTFEYDAERERGLNFQEDLFNPCVLRFDLKSNSKATVIRFH
jgi:predicted glycogen debranching enzyme